METIIGYAANHVCYINNTGIDVRGHERAILDAIKNGGVFVDDLADIFKLVKTPEGSAADWRLEFI